MWCGDLGSFQLVQQGVLQVPPQCLNLEPILEAPCWCYSMNLVGECGTSLAASHLEGTQASFGQPVVAQTLLRVSPCARVL